LENTDGGGTSVASIEGHLPAGEALRRLARAQLARLARELGAAEKGANAHPLRKRLKFLRSLLRLIRPAIGDDAFRVANTHLKTAAEELALKRHGEAMAEAIAKLAKHAETSAPVIAELEGAARSHATQAEEKLTTGLAIAKTEIEAVRALVGSWMLPKRDARLYLAGLRQCYGRGRELIAEGLATREMSTLHEARKSVIHHLHHLEILEPIWPNMIGAWCDELGKLRELLGDLNDLDELEALLAKPDSAFSKIASPDAARQLIAERREKLVERIRKRAAQLFAERPRPLARRLGLVWKAWEGRQPQRASLEIA
jgi:CHAD domain-containing protein